MHVCLASSYDQWIQGFQNDGTDLKAGSCSVPVRWSLTPPGSAHMKPFCVLSNKVTKLPVFDSDVPLRTILFRWLCKLQFRCRTTRCQCRQITGTNGITFNSKTRQYGIIKQQMCVYSRLVGGYFWSLPRDRGFFARALYLLVSWLRAPGDSSVVCAWISCPSERIWALGPHRRVDMGAVWLSPSFSRELSDFTLLPLRDFLDVLRTCGCECVPADEHALITVFVWHETELRSPGSGPNSPH